ncbi:FadR family transcriptional regulator [Gordonia McavH-238-E]|uniref:FadR/GntR family transcriptional regulator n=1 Tax=Gordonia sp. McavH-238-E TaxID=2917736 RepID=UPI001EF5ED65|nr:FadR/GntR family transcriptional regulator [Gordonia sp. McavH-238-E]MCG7632938.1 FadR family transcriptional regulator [Gordonia sp. McavH-238-E]
MSVPKPTLRRVKVAPVHELVLEELRRAVEVWAYRPGDTLPTERDLAEILGVSRNTIRTATAILESDGFLSVRRGRGGGYVVQDPTEGHDLSDEIRRNPGVVRDAWEFRSAIEIGSARLAAERRTDSDLDGLKSVLAEMDAHFAAYKTDQTLEGARLIQAFDSEFHLLIARATGNDFIVDGVTEARRRLWVAFSSYLTRLDDAGHVGHQRIVDAIEDRDGDAAARHMSEHIEAGRLIFEAWLGESSDELAETPRQPTTRGRRTRDRMGVAGR